jgi:hypothetical protein
MDNRGIALIAALLLVIGIGMYFTTYQKRTGSTPMPLIPTTTINHNATPTISQASSKPTITSQVSPIPTKSEANITVTSPKQGETIERPVTVTGMARTFEQAVSFRLKQANGKVLAEEFTTANAPDLGIFGPYEKTINYSLPTEREGVLEVFQGSAKDGSEIDKVIIKIRFSQIQQ